MSVSGDHDAVEAVSRVLALFGVEGITTGTFFGDMDLGDVVKAFRKALEDGRDSPRFARRIWKRGECVQVLRKCGLEYGSDDPDIPYTVRYFSDGKRVPWTPSHIEMLADDWYEVRE